MIAYPRADHFIDVWYVFLESIRDFHYLVPYLSHEEETLADRYKSGSAKEKFVTGRALARKMLSCRLNADPQSIVLSKGVEGKPFFSKEFQPADQVIDFNISHGKNLVACALASNTRIGIDAEKTDRDIEGTASLFLTTDELQEIQYLSGKEKQEAIYRLWTLKEAFMKCNGYGLGYMLEKVNVSSNRECFYHTFSPGDGYFISVVAEKTKKKRKFELRKREFSFHEKN